MASVALERRWVRTVLVLVSLLITSLNATSHAQPPALLTGTVVDEAGSAVPGARVTASDSRGAILQTTATDGAGTFTLRGLAPGTYMVVIEVPLFTPWSDTVTIPAEGPSPALRTVLKTAGFSETVVVTARRAEARLAETPQTIEVIDTVDLERSVAADLTDVLKKNAGVDVVQYSGVLSGIGIRGFRPQTGGINKRSLLLIDGRPSGVTNLATLLLDNVDRIEILKGAASAVYGSSAMGGVVNVITRQSRGKISGTAQAGGGSFGVSDFGGRTGGNVTRRIDFDVSGRTFDQRDDFRMGNGVVRPATSYKTFDGTARLGLDLTSRWRIDGWANGYRGRDIMTPGDLFNGVNSQGSKDIERSTQDVRLLGRAGAHALTITAYRAAEVSHTTNVTSTSAADLPFLPYLSFEGDLSWSGAQVKDSWQSSRATSLVVGVDYERVTSISRSYARSGDRTAPFSADSTKRTAGVYAENALKLRDGRTVFAIGARVDWITTETVETPFKTNFQPSETSFTVFNPSLGIKHELRKGLRAHFATGRGFIPAEAIMLTGYTTTMVGGRTQISRGNPELKPERSVSFDAGAEWTSRTTRVDLTLFRTVVKDRFISNVVISNPPPPAPIVVSVSNGLDAHISGLDFEADHRLGAHIALFANATHYFNRKERLAGGAEQDILNVAENTIRAGIDLDYGPINARVSGRHLQGRKDNNFNAPGFPIIDYDDFTVVDVSAAYRLTNQHTVLLGVNNLFDAFYYEKLGFPLQGVSFKASYRFGF
jgi:vitamin B12 transporter